VTPRLWWRPAEGLVTIKWSSGRSRWNFTKVLLTPTLGRLFRLRYKAYLFHRLVRSDGQTRGSLMRIRALLVACLVLPRAF
jgi:hypothetical protein